LRDAIKELLGTHTAREIVAQLIDQAKAKRKNPDRIVLEVIKFLRDTGEGLPSQSVELSGPDGRPVELGHLMLERKRRINGATE
jgi:hypothetical protein